MKVNQTIQNIHAPAAIAIADGIREMESQGKQIFKLQTGEPCFSTPEYIKKGMVKALESNQTRYTYSQGIPELRREICSSLNTKYGTEIAPSDIFITNGGVSAIHYAIQSVIEPGDEVIIFDPSWPQYANITSLCGGKPVNVSTRANLCIPDTGLLETNATPRTKMVVLNNPNNPTGTIIPGDTLNRMIKWAYERNIYLLFDEVYDHIVYSPGFVSALQLDNYPLYRDNIIYINSFSKTFCMTGWRLGYAIVPEPMKGNYLKLVQNSITHVSAPTQWAGVSALAEMEAHQDEYAAMLGVYNARRVEIMKLLQEKSWEYIHPDGSFYYFIKVPQNVNDFVTDLLNTHRIAVVPGIAYGKDFADYFRMSYAVDDVSYNGFVSWLKKY
ncbi:MAG: aminotransferase class I/II-fold pyridoxal phosphate-dependent enzyme [Bacteroidetes bacterium]|nr:aminotransferase class I/II-fold pyridoxal phosphate-dependent enzyme [Bacteroidota bacterium]